LTGKDKWADKPDEEDKEEPTEEVIPIEVKKQDLKNVVKGLKDVVV
jgi:hypothetical protein